MNYFTNLLTDYPDIIGTASIPMIIAILAIAIPLLIQTIGRIDDKFNSTNLVTTFRNEAIYIAFWRILIISIITYILYILQLPPLFDFGIFNFFVENSALILLVCSVISLIFITLRLFSLILTYYQTEKLLDRLIDKYKKSIKE